MREDFMERRQRRSIEQWAEIIGEQTRSGLTAKEFCKNQSIGLPSFYQWRRRLRDGDNAITEKVEAKEAFIDVGQIGAAITPEADSAPWVVTLDLGDGLKLTLQRG
jgi:hypothetical protein